MSSFNSTFSPYLDIRPLFGLLFVKALWPKALWPKALWPKAIWPILRKGPIYVFFLLLFFLSLEVKAEGGLKGGCYTKGLREERRGGEKGWGVGEGVRALQVVVLPLFFDVFFDGFVNESEISRKKVSRFFGF